jgi:hypothetical protein
MGDQAPAIAAPVSTAQPVSLSMESPLGILQAAANTEPSPADLASEYKAGFTTTLIKFVVLTIVQILILIYVFLGGGISEVLQNWPKYRCNPIMMPFAGLFGYDASENFNYCMKNIFQSNAGAVLAPLYGVMSNFTDIVGVVSNVANSFRYLIANLLHGMERLMSSFRDKFQGILFAVRLSFLKILGLMGRLYATFYAVIFMGLSALRAAENVAGNDLVKFLLEFCFDPDTPIKMMSGAVVPIREIKIGDRLAPIDGIAPVVTSVFKFNGSETPMVRINNTVVSSKHYIYYAPLASWIESGKHPEAVCAASLPELICLNTDTHTLLIDGLMYSDYDESSNPGVVASTQALAEALLNNGRHEKSTSIMNDYALGLDGSTPVTLSDGKVVRLDTISIGDILYGGGVVQGLVQEQVTWIVDVPGGHSVSASQLAWDVEGSCWRRAALLYSKACRRLEKPVTMYQLIVTNNRIISGGFAYRDYREVSAPEMEDEYMAFLKGGKN